MSNTIKINHNKATKKIRKNETFSRFNDKKVRENDHLDQVQYLMYNEKEALRLQVDNLVLTYGLEALQASVKATKLDLVSKSSRIKKGA